MPSRTKRKRHRRRAKATASEQPSPEEPAAKTLWGWGSDCPIRRGDARLAAHAVRQGWPVSEANKAAISAGIYEACLDPASSPRLVLAAADFVIAAVEQSSK